MHSSPGFLEASIVALVLALGLRGTPQDALFFACRPRLLLRTFVATQLLLPLFVMSILSALSVSSSVVVGATLLVVSPSVALLSQLELRRGGHSTLVLAASAMGALTSIITVPIWLAVLSQLFLADATIAPAAVMRLVGTLFVLPLALAIILRRLAPVMARVSGPLIVAADVLLLLVLLSLARDTAFGFRRLGVVTIVALVALSVGAVLIGHLAGGRDAPDRSLIGVLAGVRHPGLALLIAKYNFDGDLVLPAVVMSLLIGLTVTLGYALWRRGRRPDNSPAPPPLSAETLLAPPAPQ
jgi:BASS family bile acid:Na+ symporter